MTESRHRIADFAHKLQALPLEQVLAKQLEQQLEPLQASRHAAPSAWIATFNQMLLRTWQQIKYVTWPLCN